MARSKAKPEPDDAAETTAPPLADRACVLKALPKHLLAAAAEKAADVSPANRPLLHRLDAASAAPSPALIAALSTKYFGPTPRILTVEFLEPTSAALRNKILAHANKWAESGCISFAYTAGMGRVRISRGTGGYWSYLGTDVLMIPLGQQTMNLEGFTVKTPDAEYARVVQHEFGHTLGYPHEHMRSALVARIDPARATAWFRRNYGWNAQMVRSQVLTPLDEASLMSTPADETSIMCYQLPGAITTDGRPIVGGTAINATDAGFNAAIYPKPKAMPSRLVAMRDDGLGEFARAAHFGEGLA